MHTFLEYMCNSVFLLYKYIFIYDKYKNIDKQLDTDRYNNNQIDKCIYGEIDKQIDTWKKHKKINR